MSVDRRAPTAGRVKYGLILAGLAVSALVLLAWSQDWFVLALDGNSPDLVAVPGSVAAPALSALALAGLALAGALAIAGFVFRVILGVLEFVLGACIALSALLAIADPVTAGSRAVTDVTGVVGDSSIAALVSGQSSGPWPAVTLALGAVSAVVGIAIVFTAGRWPVSSSRYSAVRMEDPEHVGDSEQTDGSQPVGGSERGGSSEPVGGSELVGNSEPADGPVQSRSAAPPPDNVADWDSLSDGRDPTR